MLPLIMGLLVLVITGGIGYAGYRLLSNRQSKIVTQNQVAAEPATPTPAYRSAVASYLFSGTVMVGRAVDTYAHGNYEQPFSGMASLGTYDANIGVLECPVTGNAVSYQTQVQRLLFNCNPNYLPALKSHFPILNLSSNHLNDMGPDGYAETVRRVTAAGIQTVGNFNPHAEKDDCKTILFPVRLTQTNGQDASSKLPLAVCSYNYKIIFHPNAGELESIQKWSAVMPVIGLMNGGPEYQHSAGQAQTEVAHKMIDFGAAFVVGNGTHWAQNSEAYGGKLIIYSLGNFIFDQTDRDGRLAFNLAVTMNLPYDQTAASWIQLAKDCDSDPTTCFSLAQSRGLGKLQPRFSFGDVVSYGGYQQVARKASAAEQAYIESRANWTQTLAQLHQ